MRLVGAFVVVAAVCFVPFTILAPAGLEASVRFQLERPLQVESLGAAVLIAAHHLGLIATLTTVNGSRHTGQFLNGSGTGVAANLSTIFEVAFSHAFGSCSPGDGATEALCLQSWRPPLLPLRHSTRCSRRSI
jgi:hypothetical protein